MPGYDGCMSKGSIGLSDELNAYLIEVGVREPEVLARLREETAVLPQANMQIAIEQGALLSMLVKLLGARRVLEIGTFTGYSSTAMALALPPDGRIVCCDVSEEYTALETLEGLLATDGPGSFDLAFIDADKTNYRGYVEGALLLVRQGGLIAIDNVLWSGRVINAEDTDEDTQAIRDLNADLANDERVDIVMVPIADGLTLLRVR